MSSAWAALEALAAGDPAKFPKCPCGGPHRSRFFFDPATVERLDTRPKNLARTTATVRRMARTERRWRGEELRLGLGILPALLEKNQFYYAPQSAEEERRRFRQDLRDVLDTAPELGPDLHHHAQGYPVEFQRIEEKSTVEFIAWHDADGSPAPLPPWETQRVENIVWHYDPRLQLIRYPSFRCFVEVQVLRDRLDVTEFVLYEPKLHRGTAETIDTGACNLFHLYTVGARCAFYYALGAGVEELEASPGPARTLPMAAEEASAAGPSLSKTQRKHAKQKANKAAARLAKEAATSSSRSDYLPMLPTPKPPTAAPRKKPKKDTRAAAAAAEAAGGSLAVVESGVKGQNKTAPSKHPPKPATKKPPTGEPSKKADEPTAAKPAPDEPAKESPEPEKTAEEPSEAKAEEAPKSEASTLPSPTPEAVVERPVASLAPLSLPMVEAPTSDYALLADDLARIADRLRQARLARSAR